MVVVSRPLRQLPIRPVMNFSLGNRRRPMPGMRFELGSGSFGTNPLSTNRRRRPVDTGPIVADKPKAMPLPIPDHGPVTPPEPEQADPVDAEGDDRPDVGALEAEAVASERRGRQWLIWSFIFCPCHLPWTMSVLAAIFGGTAFGSLISRNTLGVGLIVGAIYAAGVWIGFKHLRAAAAAKDCAAGACEI